MVNIIPAGDGKIANLLLQCIRVDGATFFRQFLALWDSGRIASFFLQRVHRTYKQQVMTQLPVTVWENYDHRKKISSNILECGPQ